MKVEVRTEGFAGLHKQLGKLEKAMESAVKRRAATKALEPFVEKAKSLAAVDEGDLRDSLGIAEKQSRSGLRYNRSARRVGPDVVQVWAGPISGRRGVPHAHLVEFGTVKMAAQPFMRPAWDQTKGGMLDSIRDTLAVEIRAVTGG